MVSTLDSESCNPGSNLCNVTLHNRFELFWRPFEDGLSIDKHPSLLVCSIGEEEKVHSIDTLAYLSAPSAMKKNYTMLTSFWSSNSYSSKKAFKILDA
jgi:hypothetical protein